MNKQGVKSMDAEELNQKLAEQRAEIGMQFQARIAAILDWLEGDLGDAVAESIDRMVARDMHAEWSQLAEKEGSNTIDDLVHLLWEPMQEMGVAYTVEKTDEGVQMHVTQCPFADFARETDNAKWAYRLYCASDPHIVTGFNPQIGFRRTKTLVEGDDCCDHFYSMKT
jgi:predicted ArsR family transcriptional regulator